MDGLDIKAKAVVKLTKIDEYGSIIETTEQEVSLTREEAEALWQSQQQD